MLSGPSRLCSLPEIGPDEPDWLAEELADDLPPVEGRTQREKVINALKAGADTSVEIAGLTRLSVKTCAAYLYALTKSGVVRRRSEFSRRYAEKGSGSHVYELIDGPVPVAAPSTMLRMVPLPRAEHGRGVPTEGIEKDAAPFQGPGRKRAAGAGGGHGAVVTPRGPSRHAPAARELDSDRKQEA